MTHNPVSIVRLLYGERAQKRKPRRSAFSQSCQQQFDIRPPIGQGHRSRMSGMGDRSAKPVSLVDLVLREVVA